MGQKVNPIGFRVGLTGNWLSKWYAPSKDFGTLLIEDINVRDAVKKKLQFAGISRVQIERVTDRIRVTIATARPGLVIGRRGDEVEKLNEMIRKMTGKEVYIEIEEIKRPETEAQLVAENVAQQLEKRASFKRVIKRAAQTAMDFGADGVRIIISGRLGGTEIARRESVRLGKLPLHTLRADIDYGFAESHTTYGSIGCKVYICKGEKMSLKANTDNSALARQRRRKGPRAHGAA
ncbi:MAG: 30S ribosomal protein S3 [bacterium]|nr:30S ribosomal protein S3 [bacterium]